LLTIRLSLRRRRSPGIRSRRASAAHYAVGHRANRIYGSATADIRGTPSTPEESAQPASASGRKRNASRAPDGRRIRIGTRSSESSFRSLAQNAPIQEVEIGCKLRGRCSSIALCARPTRACWRFWDKRLLTATGQLRFVAGVHAVVASGDIILVVGDRKCCTFRIAQLSSIARL
jgi:hypothetical protein